MIEGGIAFVVVGRAFGAALLRPLSRPRSAPFSVGEQDGFLTSSTMRAGSHMPTVKPTQLPQTQTGALAARAGTKLSPSEMSTPAMRIGKMQS